MGGGSAGRWRKIYIEQLRSVFCKFYWDNVTVVKMKSRFWYENLKKGEWAGGGY
jgi:hypothetical protein